VELKSALSWLSAATPTLGWLDVRLSTEPRGLLLLLDLALTSAGERAWGAVLADEPWEPEPREPALLLRLRFDPEAGVAAAGPPLTTSAGEAPCPDLESFGPLIFWPQALAGALPGSAGALHWLRPRTASLEATVDDEGFQGRLALRVARPPDAVRRFLTSYDVVVPEDGTGVVTMPFASLPAGVRVDPVEGGSRVSFSAGQAPGGPGEGAVAPPGLAARGFVHAARFRQLLGSLDVAGPLPEVLPHFEEWVESLALEVRVRKGQVRAAVRVRWANVVRAD